MKKRAIQFPIFLFVAVSLTIALPSGSLWAKSTATITGAIYDSETGEPLPGVTIMVKGTKMGTYSDLDGYFKLRNLQPGTHTLIFSVIGYKDSRIADLQVNPGESKRLDDILLAPEAIEVKGVEVTAKRVTHTEAALLRIQMKAPAISDGISAEQIAKSPDSDAAGALKRMAGVTVVSGKYVYVRGMGERYSNTLLNGASLPSPEPKKRVIPMDLIPANFLENVVITKTFTPDQWGNFSGGSVRLNTKEFPEKFTLKFSASSGGNSQTTGKRVYRSPGGNSDWIGVDDRTRDIPDVIEEASNNGWSGVGGWNGEYTSAELAEMFRPAWDGRGKKAPLNQSYNVSIGSQTELFKRPLGFIFSLTYSNKYNYREEIQKTFNAGSGGLALRSDWDIEKSSYSVLWGGIFNLNCKLHPYHKLLLNATYTRDAEDEVRWMDGYYEDRMWLENRLKWMEQFLAHLRLTGEHELPTFLSSRLDWSASYGDARRKEPDESTLLWCKDSPEDPDDMYYINSQKSGGNRFWEDTKDKNYSFSVDWTKDFKQWSGLPAKFKLGWATEKINREDHVWFFDLSVMPAHGWYQDKQELKENRPVDAVLKHATGVRWAGAQSYQADKTITATYIQFDTPVLKRLRMVAGIRMEDTDMEIIYNPVGAFPLDENVKKDHTDWLPSVNLTYSLTDKMNLRFGAAKTITRPEYFELIEREDSEIFENLKSFGNPDLKHTLIWNFDTRWELYPRPGELFAVSYFYKKFKRPIENIFTIMGTLTLIPVNIKGAHNYGFEFEVRKNLDFLGHWMSNFSVNANYSIIKSLVEIDQTGGSSFKPTNTERALIGQSPYVLNFTLGYENDHGTTARILCNRFGERIAYPGASGNPDVVEKPFTQLDFVFEQKFFGRLGFKLNVANLLDSEGKFMQGEELWRLYKKGISYSAGLSYSI